MSDGVGHGHFGSDSLHAPNARNLEFRAPEFNDGYSKDQPWHNSGFTESGELRPEYVTRLEQVLSKADELAMVVIVGYFNFGQDQ